jgi:hypothetical protein
MGNQREASAHRAVRKDDRHHRQDRVPDCSVFKFLGRLEEQGKVGPGLTIHGLRHTSGTLMHELGFDKDTIADMLGQEDPAWPSGTRAMLIWTKAKADRRREEDRPAFDACERGGRRTKLSNFAGKKCLTAILFSLENDVYLMKSTGWGTRIRT